ncbi:MAG: hypothetical protein J6P93_05805 [Alphaproteobacteria bacterium]|nr:hypothetical protein [Alphaproteobacteria bacterium]
MKKILFLSILSCLISTVKANAVDVFALPTNEKTIYEKGFPLNEYLIYTPDKKCFLHFLSTTPPAMYKNIQIIQQADLEGVQCLEKGFASVNITDDNNNLIQNLNGYFLNGFFIGSLPLNSYAIKRSAERNGTQNLFYFIDKDDNLKIQYVGKMQAHLKNNVYSHFEACYPFEILLQTQNKSLFEDDSTIKNLFTVAKSYAQTICPHVDHIVLSATDSPSLDKSGLFFQRNFYRDATTDAWIQEDIKAVANPSMEEPVAQYTGYTLPVPAQKVPETYSQEYVIHISDKTNDKVLFVDEPHIMKAKQTDYTIKLKAGRYYKVKATLKPMDDLEKKRTGISLKEKADIIDIISAKSCNDSSCR